MLLLSEYTHTHVLLSFARRAGLREIERGMGARTRGRRPLADGRAPATGVFVCRYRRELFDQFSDNLATVPTSDHFRPVSASQAYSEHLLLVYFDAYFCFTSVIRKIASVLGNTQYVHNAHDTSSRCPFDLQSPSIPHIYVHYVCTGHGEKAFQSAPYPESFRCLCI